MNDVFKKADARYNDGDEENSYILFMRYFHILESIKKTYEYQKHKVATFLNSSTHILSLKAE